MSGPDHPDEARQDTAGRPRRFAFGLLVYLLLTVALFAVVSRYAIRVAALYGYDIKNEWLQFGLYGGLLAAASLAAYVAIAAAERLQAIPAGLVPSTEARLRLAFLGGMTANGILAAYQSRYGRIDGANYFVVGSLGCFAVALALTHRHLGLVEIVSRPPEAIRSVVEAGHLDVALANSRWDRTKRALELVVALLLIVVSLPISIPLAMLLWLQDPGPLLVAKVAVKRGGASFNQLKLRTMVKGAERSCGPVPAAPDDPRVTPLGALLRRTHIDELSQVINIARGDMSLVGPRPERTVFVHRHLGRIGAYRLRHAVRPGLAGMAQVYGDYYSTPRQKLHYDLLYIRRRSFGLDAKLFGTAVLMALFGIQPGRRRHRRERYVKQHQDERWRHAYEALRGDTAPPRGAERATDLPREARGRSDRPFGAAGERSALGTDGPSPVGGDNPLGS